MYILSFDPSFSITLDKLKCCVRHYLHMSEWYHFSENPGQYTVPSSLQCRWLLLVCGICSGYFPWSFHIGPLSPLSAGCQCHGQPVGSHTPYRCHPPPLQMSPSHLNIIRCSSLMISSGGNMAAPDAKKSTVAVSPGPPHSLSRNKSPAWSLTQQQSPNLSIQSL